MLADVTHRMHPLFHWKFFKENRSTGSDHRYPREVSTETWSRKIDKAAGKPLFFFELSKLFTLPGFTRHWNLETFRKNLELHICWDVKCSKIWVSKNSGTPKWMVYKGKPYFLMDDLGGPPLHLGTHDPAKSPQEAIALISCSLISPSWAFLAWNERTQRNRSTEWTLSSFAPNKNPKFQGCGSVFLSTRKCPTFWASSLPCQSIFTDFEVHPRLLRKIRDIFIARLPLQGRVERSNLNFSRQRLNDDLDDS